MVLRKSSWFIAKVLSSIAVALIFEKKHWKFEILELRSFHRLLACSTAILSFCVGFLSLFFFWTDGKRFVEFLLEEQKKKERAKSSLKQKQQPPGKTKKEKRLWCSVQQLTAPKERIKTVGLTTKQNRSTNQGCWGKEKAKLNCWKSSFVRRATSSSENLWFFEFSE